MPATQLCQCLRACQGGVFEVELEYMYPVRCIQEEIARRGIRAANGGQEDVGVVVSVTRVQKVSY